MEGQIRKAAVHRKIMTGKIMTTCEYPLLAAMIVAVGLSANTRAGEVLRSPRDQSNQPKIASVPAANDPDLLHPYTGIYLFSPRALGNRETVATLGSQSADPDLVRATRAIVYTGKNPGRDLQRPVLGVAPLTT